MGLLICIQHGEREGVLACEHVAEAVRKDSPLGFHYAKIDLLSNGSVMLVGVICEDCFLGYGIEAGMVLNDFGPARKLECPLCIEEWSAKYND